MDRRRAFNPVTPRPVRALARASSGLLLAWAIGCDGPADEQVRTVADLLPPSTALAIEVRDLDALVERLDVRALRSRHPGLIARGSTALENAIGFDLLQPDSARARGLDPQRSLGIAFLSDPAGAAIMVLPGDGERLVTQLHGVFQRRGASREKPTRHRGVEVHAADRAGAAYFALADHVVVLSGVSRPDRRLDLCRALIDDAGRRTLSTDAAYERVRERAREDADVLVYLAPTDSSSTVDPLDALGPELAPVLTATGAPGPHEGRVLAARVGRDHFTLTSHTRLARPHDVLPAKPQNARIPDPFLDRLPSEPIFAVQLNVVTEKVVPFLEGFIAGWIQAGPGDASGSPVPSGLATRLTGRVGLLANRVGIIGSDVVAYAESPSPEAAAALLDSVVTGLKVRPIQLPMLGSTANIQDDVERGVPFHRLGLPPFVDLCAAAIDDHVVVTTTRARMARIIEGRESFLPRLPGTVRDAVRDGRLAAVYVDLTAASKVIGALPLPAAAQAERLVDTFDMFETLSLVTGVDGNIYAAELSAAADGAIAWSDVIESLLVARGRAG